MLGDQKKLLENVHCISITEVIGDLSYSCFGAVLETTVIMKRVEELEVRKLTHQIMKSP